MTVRIIVVPVVLFVAFLSVPKGSVDHSLYPEWTTRTDTVDILFAEKARRTELNGQPVRELEGSVRLRQKETLLNARKVTQFLTKDEIIMTGDVLIIQHPDSVFADRVRYDTSNKIGYAFGNVRLTDGEVEVFAPSAVYFTNEKHAIFEENVQLIDSMTVLTSDKGEYFSESKRAEFFQNVVLEEDKTYLEADSVTYFRDTEIAYGYGDVSIERIGGDERRQQEERTRTFLFGDYAYNDNRNGYSLIEGNAFLFQVQLDTLGALSDSLLIKATRLESTEEDSLQRLIAVDSVEIWRNTFSAVADSVVYDRATSEDGQLYEYNRLYRDPVTWFKEYQLTGDSLLATAYEGQIDSLFAYYNSFLAFQDSVTGRINQLKGEQLVGLFEQDSLKSLEVSPQAESIYFQQGQNNQLRATKMSGDRITLLFRNNELNRVSAASGVQGELYDGSLIPSQFELSGFRWLSQRRPEDIKLIELLDKDRFVNKRINNLTIPSIIEQELPIIATQPIPDTNNP